MRGRLSVATFAACLAAPALAFAQHAEDAPLPQAAAAVSPAHDPSDPWEGFNRDLFAVHESLDQALVEPIARGYRAVTPRPVRTGVRNFLRNLRGPVIFANDVLQGEFERAGATAGRFALNSTIGVAGVFDPADRMGLAYHDEDFGQTLAVWGVQSGPYIFVPLLGPSTVRDGAGRIVDVVFDPLTWADFDEVDETRIARATLTALSARESVLDAVDDVRRNAIDPYVTIRSSYALLRESAIRNGESSVEDLPEFEPIDDAEADTDAFDNKTVTEDNSQHSGLNQPEAMSDDLAEDVPAPMSGEL